MYCLHCFVRVLGRIRVHSCARGHSRMVALCINQDPEYFNSLRWIQENDPDCLELYFALDEEGFGEVRVHIRTVVRAEARTLVGVNWNPVKEPTVNRPTNLSRFI